METGLVERFLSFVRSLSLDFETVPAEFFYDNPVLILLDAVLSINRPYEKFVVPRIELARKWPIRALSQLKAEIAEVGVQGFCDRWHYQHPERVGILATLVDKFLEIKNEVGIADDLAALQFWGERSSVDDFSSFRIRGVGFTTFQYLRLLCGAVTAKPDVHLKRAVEDGIGKRLTEREVVALVEETARRWPILARRLDYALWRYYSQNRG